MQKAVFCILMSLALTFCAKGGVPASPVTYTDQGVGTGYLGALSFTETLVTISFTGDTANIYTFSAGLLYNPEGTATVKVMGTTATFTGNVFAFVNQTEQAAGIVDFTAMGSVLDTFHAAFAAYDLTTAIGPVTGAAFIRPDLVYGTTAGLFHLDAIGDTTFTAAPVPIPGTLWLLGAGLAGLLYPAKKHLGRFVNTSRPG